MYSKFYSPNVIGVGSSKLDQSSYSHHADGDVGVAVIDRFTYYNLEFLENQVHDQSSKLTLGDLFDSYDEGEIHSTPGFRYDLFRGGESEARSRLVMDFFGNVQNVEGAKRGAEGDRSWQEDLAALQRLVEKKLDVNATSHQHHLREPVAGVSKEQAGVEQSLYEGSSAFSTIGKLQGQTLGLSVLVGSVSLWFAGAALRRKT